MKAYAPSSKSAWASVLPKREESRQKGAISAATTEASEADGQAEQIATENIWGGMMRNVQRAAETDGTLRGRNGLVVQRKMMLGKVGDRYEQEADRLAPQIVRQINSPGLEKQSEDAEAVEKGKKPTIQLKALRPSLQLNGDSTGETVSPVIESAINSARGHGKPLESGLRQRLEQMMGQDFSGVRVHTDSRADMLNHIMRARAFTTGQDLFFKQGAYQPHTVEGQELTAHELTHVMQQRQNTIQRYIEEISTTGSESDSILKRIAEEIRIHNETPNQRALEDLFFSVDYWLKVAGATTKRRKYSTSVDFSRKDEITIIYSKIANTLAQMAGVSLNNLPAYLERRYGKGMEGHGIDKDIKNKNAMYLSEDERDVYRLHIKSGKLYQYPWWKWDRGKYSRQLKRKHLVAADSSHSTPTGKMMTPNHSGFVMSMGGDLYMGTHATPEGKGLGTGFYHSSYFSGMTVACAGEIHIESGYIKSVNPRSGHYRPTNQHFTRFLKYLRLQGIDISQIDVKDFWGQSIGSGEKVLEGIISEEEKYNYVDDLEDTLNPDEEHFIANDEKIAEEKHSIFLGRLFEGYKAEIRTLEEQVRTAAANGKTREKNTKRYVLQEIPKINKKIKKHTKLGMEYVKWGVTIGPKDVYKTHLVEVLQMLIDLEERCKEVERN